MADKSAIEWTDASWTPIRARNRKTGKVGWHCEHATTGCEFCYAEVMNKRLGTGIPFKPGHRKDIEIFLDEEMLLAPLRWKKPRMIFVCSMTDAFASFVTDKMLDMMFAVMALSPQHTFQVLTKRADRMRRYCMDEATPYRVARAVLDLSIADKAKWTCEPWPVQSIGDVDNPDDVTMRRWPLPNVWLGVSTERQQEADERIPLLLNTPAAVRFISAEPLLGPINLKRLCIVPQKEGSSRAGIHVNALAGRYCESGMPYLGDWDVNGPCPPASDKRQLDWVIVGGESGPGARPMHPDWARSLRDQCAAADVPFFFKQWGEWQDSPEFIEGDVNEQLRSGRLRLVHQAHHVDAEYKDRCVWPGDTFMVRIGKKAAGRILDGKEHNAFPQPKEVPFE